MKIQGVIFSSSHYSSVSFIKSRVQNVLIYLYHLAIPILICSILIEDLKWLDTDHTHRVSESFSFQFSLNKIKYIWINTNSVLYHLFTLTGAAQPGNPYYAPNS